MYIGIDVGGTNLKAGLVNENGEIVSVIRRPLNFQGADSFAATLAGLASQVIQQANITAADVKSVGIGIPGAVRGGDILYTANIPMRNVPLEKLFRQHLDLPVFLANDADCAAVGEYLFGAGRGTKDFIVVTLGTGVGGGLILNGKLHTGLGCGGEVGHMTILPDGVTCGCGRRGCWESYASATGLIRLAREAMEQHPESLLHTLENGHVEGKTVFEAAQKGDAAAVSVCRDYVNYLAAGIINLVNILHPEVVAIGGGVAAAPNELLLNPLQQVVNDGCYAHTLGLYTKITRAEMGNDAGIIGAALLQRIL